MLSLLPFLSASVASSLNKGDLDLSSAGNLSHNRAKRTRISTRTCNLHQLLGITGITGKLHDDFSPYWVHFSIIGSKTVRGATFYLPRSYRSPYGHSEHVCSRDTQKCANCKHLACILFLVMVDTIQLLNMSSIAINFHGFCGRLLASPYPQQEEKRTGLWQ